ncbi:MAG: alpha/beta hydrolase [Chloroherpetonaceae bacterium]|nr:alpha/beta hydrolase [Chloroherpetonaceae bacterium]MDW8437126.1 alpha/beta hydrolase [Chloroherpetonaceae bacterium]
MTIEAESKYITLSGYRHRYIDEGGGSRVIFLAHGFSSSLDIFYRVVPLFAERYRVLALDLLAFGKSDKPTNIRYSLELYAKLIKEFLEKTCAQGDAIYGVGHSMGAKYLVAMSVYHPNFFSKLVLSNSDGFLYLPPFIMMASSFLLKPILYRLVSTPAFVRKTMRSVYHDPSHVTEEHLRRNIEMVRSRENFEAMMSLNRDFKHLDLQRMKIRSRLKEMKTPTLVIWGANDKFIPVKYANVVQREIPNSRLVLIPECGHVPMVEKPREFFEAVDNFINEKT